MGCRYALGELCEFRRGASIPRARMLDKGGYLYIHYGDLYKGFSYRIDVKHPQKPISHIRSDEKIKDSQWLEDQDIVYVLTSETVDDLGHAFLFNNPEHMPAVSGTETTIVHVNRPNVVIPAYLNYLMHAPLFVRMLRQYVRGMKVFRVHPDDVARIEVDVPTLDKQRKIVSMLDAIQAKLCISSHTNDYLEQCLLARYDHLFGANYAYDGTIADIGDIIGGATPSKKKPEYYCADGIGWITPRDLSNTTDKFIAHGADDISQLGYDSCSVRMLPAGTVLFSSRAPIGYIAIATDNVTTNQGFKSVVPHEEIGTAFVYCFLKRNKDRIADAGSGTTFPEVSSKTMAGIELSVPDSELCAEFSEWAKPLLEQQCYLEEENRRLGELRDTLLPKLMSGEVDVRGIELPTQPNNHLCAD